MAVNPLVGAPSVYFPSTTYFPTFLEFVLVVNDMFCILASVFQIVHLFTYACLEVNEMFHMYLIF